MCCVIQFDCRIKVLIRVLVYLDDCSPVKERTAKEGWGGVGWGEELAILDRTIFMAQKLH